MSRYTGYIATINNPTQYQRTVRHSQHAIVIQQVDRGAPDAHSRWIVGTILRAAKSWDGMAHRCKNTVQINNMALSREWIKTWLKRKFPELTVI